MYLVLYLNTNVSEEKVALPRGVHSHEQIHLLIKLLSFHDIIFCPFFIRLCHSTGTAIVLFFYHLWTKITAVCEQWIHLMTKGSDKQPREDR